MTLAMWFSLVFTDAGMLIASERPLDEAYIVEASTRTAQVLVVEPRGVDPIITGPTGRIAPRGILPLLDGCDAACQADRLGLSFE